MYTVYMDGLTMHNIRMKELRLFEPKLSHEVNKAGTFTFTIYRSHPYIDMIKKMKSIITIKDESGVIWRGRVLNSTSGFRNQMTCTCEGEMAFLNDSRIRTYDYQGDLRGYFEFLVEQHNAQVDENMQFIIGNVTVSDPNDYLHFSSAQYPKTLEEINTKLIGRYGGYIWFRHEADGVYIDYLKDSDLLCDQKIEFGKNLLDLTTVVKGQDVATVIIPRGAKILDDEGNETEERVSVSSVNNGKDYVSNEEAVALYGRIATVVTWDDVTEPVNLLRKAQAYAADAGNLVASITLTAIDLHHMDLSISSFRLFRYVQVVSKPHELDELYLIKKIDIDLTNPTYGKLVTGNTFKTLTDKQVDTSNKATQVVQIVENVKSDYEINKKKIEKILAGLEEGEVVVSSEEPEKKGLWCDTSVTPPLLKKWNADLDDWEVVNDNAEQITHIYKELSSSINQMSESILIQVGEKTYTKEETDRLVSDINTSFEQTKNSFNFEFNNFKKNLDDLANSTDAKFENTSKYIRLIDGEIFIGVEGNPIMLHQRNDRISFLENNAEVAYISNRTLYFTHAEILKDLKIGQFGFVVMESGYVPFKLIE